MLARAFLLLSVALFTRALGAQAVIPVAPGTVTITVTYIQPNGTQGSTTINLVVTNPPVALIRPINALNPPRWDLNALTRWPFCPVAWATDAAGNTLVGIPVSWSTGDSSIARTALDPKCPKASVDPALLQAIPVPTFTVPVSIKP